MAAPLVIGGTGGSGTRLIAQLCINAGYHLGEHLNGSLDALDFYDFYDRWLTSYLSNTLDTAQQQALRTELLAIIDTMYAAVPAEQHQRWGWKTPRSLLLLPLLDQCVKELRFIHVIRDGRDMAYSSNQNQLRKHGAGLLNASQHKQPEPIQSISFWNIANLHAARYGQTAMPDRYIWLRYEDVAANDSNTMNRLAAFLILQPEQYSKLHGYAHSPATTGRWTQYPAEERHLLTAAGSEGLRFFGYL